MQAVFELEGCEVAERRVKPLGIVEGFNVVEEDGLSFARCAGADRKSIGF